MSYSELPVPEGAEAGVRRADAPEGPTAPTVARGRDATVAEDSVPRDAIYETPRPLVTDDPPVSV